MFRGLWFQCRKSSLGSNWAETWVWSCPTSWPRHRPKSAGISFLSLNNLDFDHSKWICTKPPCTSISTLKQCRTYELQSSMWLSKLSLTWGVIGDLHDFVNVREENGSFQSAGAQLVWVCGCNRSLKMETHQQLSSNRRNCLAEHNTYHQQAVQ